MSQADRDVDELLKAHEVDGDPLVRLVVKAAWQKGYRHGEKDGFREGRYHPFPGMY